MGVAPILSYFLFELLHSTIDSYDAGFVEFYFFLRLRPASTLTKTPDGFWPLTPAGTPVSPPGRLYVLRFRADSPVYPISPESRTIRLLYPTHDRVRSPSPIRRLTKSRLLSHQARRSARIRACRLSAF